MPNPAFERERPSAMLPGALVAEATNARPA